MKKYRVNVNGTNYDITVEELTGAEATAPAAAPAAPAAAPAPAPAAAPAGGTKVVAPMPGNILAVNVKDGDSVKKGQVLMILEALKMDNEILAAADGVVSGVSVAKGQTVDTGALLCVIG